MSKLLLSVMFLFLTSVAQASTCTIAKINELGFSFDATNSEFDHNKLSFVMSTPSSEYGAEVKRQFIGGKWYRQLIIRSNTDTTSALFQVANEHPFLSMINDGVVVQFQCWLDLDGNS